MELYHGGAPGLKAGDELLPPVLTGFKRSNDVITGKAPRGRTRAYRRNLVYATSDRILAEAMAFEYTADTQRLGTGWLYRVEFDEVLIRADEDFPTLGTSFQAPRGTILQNLGPVFSFSEQHALTLQRYVDAGKAATRAAEESAARERMEKKLDRQSRDAARRDRRAARKHN
jgi:hypothetical protein